jgi:hypothetical protein
MKMRAQQRKKEDEDERTTDAALKMSKRAENQRCNDEMSTTAQQ